MITEATFMGNALETGLAGDVTLYANSRKVQSFWPKTTTERNVTLPDATRLKNGGPIFYIINEGLGNVVVKRNGGSELVTLAPEESTELWMLDNSTAAGDWLYRTVDTPSLAMVQDLPMDLDYFSSVYAYQATSPSVSVVDDRLVISGVDNGAGRIGVGNIGGRFLPCRAKGGSVECCIDDFDTSSNINGAGIIIPNDIYDMSNGLQYLTTSWTSYVEIMYYSGANDVRIWGKGGSGATGTGYLGSLPASDNPFWLKFTWELSGTNMITYTYYRIGDVGAYTQITTNTLPITTQWAYKFDAGPFIVAGSAGDARWGKFKRIIHRVTK